MHDRRPDDTPSIEPKLTRAEFLRWSGTAALTLAGAAAGGTACTNAARSAEAAESDDREKTTMHLARFVREYDQQGIHRTGTPVDRASADWLADEVAAAGIEAQLDPMPFSRIDVVECFVELPSGERIEGIPLFDSPPTDAEGVAGRLGEVPSDAAIGVAEVAPLPSLSPEFFAQRSQTRQLAQLAVTGGERWGLPEGFALINAERYTSPFGPPVLQLPSGALDTLRQAQGQTLRCVARVIRQEVEVYNVTATVPGSDPVLPPLVVMTPRSGWWHCASERGGGIALWLDLLRFLASSQPARTTHFVASTGHELGHYGLDHFLEQRAAWIAGARAWIHLGANFAAAVGGGIRLQTSDDDLESLALGAMKEAGIEPKDRTPAGTRPFGEARNIFDGGGRYLSLLGTNGLFHHPADRWPDAVDMPLLEALAAAFRRVASELVQP